MPVRDIYRLGQQDLMSDAMILRPLMPHIEYQNPLYETMAADFTLTDATQTALTINYTPAYNCTARLDFVFGYSCSAWASSTHILSRVYVGAVNSAELLCQILNTGYYTVTGWHVLQLTAATAYAFTMQCWKGAAVNTVTTNKSAMRFMLTVHL